MWHTLHAAAPFMYMNFGLHGLDLASRVVWVNDVLLGNASIELGIGFWGIIEGDDLNVGGLGEVDFVVQDSVHQLTVVSDDWALSGVEAERLGPSEANPSGDVAFFSGLGGRARIASDVESWNTDLTGGLGDLHHVVEDLGRLLNLMRSAAAATGFKANAVDSRVNFWSAEDLEDLVGDREIPGNIDGFATKRSGVGETFLVVVADDHAGSAEELARRSRGKADWTGTCNVDGGAWANVGLDGAVESSREDVRQSGQASNLFHGLVLVWELQQVKVGVWDHDVLRLSTDPTAHIDVAVGSAWPSWVDVEADASVSGFAHRAPTASNVERDGAEVALLDELDVRTALDHFASNLVPKNHARGGGGSASDHVLIGTADVGCGHFEDNPMVALSETRVEFTSSKLKLWELGVLNFSMIWAHVDNATVARGKPLLREGCDRHQLGCAWHTLECSAR
jgi:hypothetical protein